MKNKLWISLVGIFLCTVSSSVIATEQQGEKNYAPYPHPDRGYITDHANLLTSEQEQMLEDLLYTCEKRYGFEMAVVTIHSIKDYAGTANSSIESFATGLFDTYGIGNMPKNNGVLLLVAVKDRKARIELGAYYGRSRDRDANRIMQKVIIPQFKRDRYDKGVIKGTHALLNEFAGIRVIPGWTKLVVIGAIVILIPVTISLFRNGKRGWGWICAGLIIVLLLALLALVKNTVEHMPDSAGAGGFGGGFGGGCSGGGGATGSW
ncbi:MAG: TPM domain-containing protein [Planctomycetota bacterium]